MLTIIKITIQTIDNISASRGVKEVEDYLNLTLKCLKSIIINGINLMSFDNMFCGN